MKRKSFTFTCLTLSAMAIASLASCSNKQDAHRRLRLLSAKFSPLSLQTLNCSKTTRPPPKGKTDIEIRPQVSGFITRVHVDEGQRVRKGQALFTIDQVQYQAAVDQGTGFGKRSQDCSCQRPDQRRQQQGTLRPQHNQRKHMAGELQPAPAGQGTARPGPGCPTNAKKNLSYTVVTAPSDGVVGTIPRAKDRSHRLSSVTPSPPSPTTLRCTPTFAHRERPPRYDRQRHHQARCRHQGHARCVFTLADGTKYPIQGKVATVSGIIDNSTGAASVRALFDNPSGMLRSGNTGMVNIPVTAENAIVIPRRPLSKSRTSNTYSCSTTQT